MTLSPEEVNPGTQKLYWFMQILDSDLAHSLALAARSHLTLALDGKLDRARELTMALERSKNFFSTMQI